MSRLRYTVTLQFEADAMDTETIRTRLESLSDLGMITETKVRTVAEKKPERHSHAVNE